MLDLLKDFSSKKLELLKLEATEKSSLTVGTAVILLFISFFALFFLILCNIGLGLLIGQWLDNLAYGMLIMAGIYLLLILILILGKKGIKNVIANKIIKSLYQ